MISKGNHVKFACFVLLTVSEEAQTLVFFCFVQCIMKQLLDSVFVISKIIKVSVRVISLSNPYLDLDYSGYKITCKLLVQVVQRLDNAIHQINRLWISVN